MCISFADGGRLGWSCQRKLGRIRLAERVDAFVRDMRLGPDALSAEMTEAAFADRIGKSRGSVKSALMNQSAIAGIGNVYADEILHQAGIHPGRKPVELGAGAFRNLYDSMRDVLERAIAAGAAPEKMPAQFLLPRREAGAACACGTPIEKIIISGRTGYYCPRCQT
jgi:formamidopyrimidine-DNA glycosylase